MSVKLSRRDLLKAGLSLTAAATGMGMFAACAQPTVKPASDPDFVKSINIIDAHAHPDQFFKNAPISDSTSTIAAIKELKMSASSFSAVGDRSNPYGTPLSFYQSAKIQLARVQSLTDSGQVKLVVKASDIPSEIGPGQTPGAILAIEGGDPLEGKPDRVNEFYDLGVRMITLVHYRNNELGDIMAGWAGKKVEPVANGLTPAGRKVLERLQDLGMVVDVAHAHPLTLRGIAEITSKPLIDSHTSPCSSEDPSQCWRYRTWKDMELTVKTGGVVCTWPIKRLARRTFLDWAKEILEMKSRLGMEHVGLGTDGGGGVHCIDGYRDVRDLVHLVAAMKEVGLSDADIKLYMGGNFYRVLRECIG